MQANILLNKIIPSKSNIIMMAFFAASLIHLPNYIKLYGYSLTNWIIVLIIGLMLVRIDYQHLIKRSKYLFWNLPFILFLGYGIVITILNEGFTNKSSLQNFFVYSSFFVALLFTGLSSPLSLQKYFGLFKNAFLYLLIALIAIELIELSRFGLEWGDNLIRKYEMSIDARSLVMLMLLVLSWNISIWVIKKDKSYFYIALILWIFIFVSLSRMAFMISTVVLLIGIFMQQFKSIKHEIIAFVLVFASLALITWSFDTPLKNRYISSSGIETSTAASSDSFSTKNRSFDVSGRHVLWGELWDSYLKSPYLGQGIGSAETIKREGYWSTFSSVQPCNDHLRILHDFGSIGYGLLILQIIVWISLLVKSYLREANPIHKIFIINGLLFIFVIGSLAITDNPLIYSYVMLPFGIMMGLCLALVNHENSSHS